MRKGFLETNNNDVVFLLGKRIICSEGFFSNNSRCHPCPIGRFQPRKGATWCDLCPVGTYQDKTGQVSCVLCNDGTYQNETGGSECHQCPQDGFEDHCLERDQRVASETHPWSHINCDLDTIGYFYSKYSYSTYRSSENRTECICELKIISLWAFIYKIYCKLLLNYGDGWVCNMKSWQFLCFFFFNRDSGDPRHVFYPFLLTLFNRRTNQNLHIRNHDKQSSQRMRI